jgi:hypothetical protein
MRCLGRGTGLNEFRRTQLICRPLMPISIEQVSSPPRVPKRIPSPALAPR